LLWILCIAVGMGPEKNPTRKERERSSEPGK